MSYSSLAFLRACPPSSWAGFACRETPPDPRPYVRSIALEALDASCTEAWLKVTLTDSNEPRTVALRRDDSVTVVSALRLLRSDTLIVDEGLLPNRTYTYKAYRVTNNQPTDSTSQLTVQTLDTTSHNFTWQIDTLGDGGGSVLYDVAIINDTLAYAVGEIYKRDSVGNWDPLPYNLVKWNGQRWELKRVTVMYRGSPITPPLNAIFAFSASDIWLSSGVPIHGDGYNWTQYHLFDMGILSQNDGSINKIWGTSSNIWFVGNRGTIVHYDGTRWRRVESGTGLPIMDIYGAKNPMSGKGEILAVASRKYLIEGKKLLRIEGLNCTSLPDSGLSWSLSGLWFDPGKRYFVVGAGIHSKRSLDNEGTWQVYPSGVVTSLYSHAIRGNSVNDVWVGGAFGEIVHFNGYSWHNYTNDLARPMAKISSIAVKGDVVVAVGDENPLAVVIMGRRK